MKILIILSTLLPLCAFCQEPEGVKPNAIIEFVQEKRGEKVGKGVCFDLVREAFERNDKKWYKSRWSKKSRYKEVIPEPGDIVMFSRVKILTRDGPYYISNHIGIVMNIKDSVLTYGDQNIIGKDTPVKYVRHYGDRVKVARDSSVGLSCINLREVKSGKLIYYRF